MQKGSETILSGEGRREAAASKTESARRMTAGEPWQENSTPSSPVALRGARNTETRTSSTISSAEGSTNAPWIKRMARGGEQGGGARKAGGSELDGPRPRGANEGNGRLPKGVARATIGTLSSRYDRCMGRKKHIARMRRCASGSVEARIRQREPFASCSGTEARWALLLTTSALAAENGASDSCKAPVQDRYISTGHERTH